jgi:hypothetical protein
MYVAAGIDMNTAKTLKKEAGFLTFLHLQETGDCNLCGDYM